VQITGEAGSDCAQASFRVEKGYAEIAGKKQELGTDTMAKLEGWLDGALSVGVLLTPLWLAYKIALYALS